MAAPVPSFNQIIPNHPFNQGNGFYVFLGPNFYASLDYTGYIAVDNWVVSSDGITFYDSGVPYNDIPYNPYYTNQYSTQFGSYLVFGIRDFGSDSSTLTFFDGENLIETGPLAASAINCGIASSGSVIATVTDVNGYEFTKSTGPGNISLTGPTGLPNYGWLDLVYFKGLFYAVGYNDDNPGVATSPDGETWTYDSSFWPFATYGGIFATSDDYLVCSSFSGQNNVLYVWDGSSMTSSVLPFDINAGSNQMNLFYNPHENYFVLINEDLGLVATTTDFEDYSEAVTVDGGVVGGGCGYGISGGFVIYGNNGAMRFDTAPPAPPTFVQGSDFWMLESGVDLTYIPDN